MILTENSSASYTPCPAGSYLARCCQLVDLGTQTSDFQGEVKHARKVLIGWEILDDEARRDDGQHFILSKRFTASLHEKAALRKTLVSWRGREFTPDELRGFDLKVLLGITAFINVVQVEKDGKTFANIAAVMRPPKGMSPPVNPVELMTKFDLNDPDWQVFAALPSRLQDQIAMSPEYQALPNKPKAIGLAPAPARPTPGATPTPPAPTTTAPAAPAGSGFDDLADSDIPF